MKSIEMYMYAMFQSAPEDLKTLLWILLGGSAGVIGYLYISKEKQKEKDQERFDKLVSEFNNYKDKTSDERVELVEKMLASLNAFKNGIDNLPEKIVSKSIANCQKNLEDLINRERNGRTE